MYDTGKTQEDPTDMGVRTYRNSRHSNCWFAGKPGAQTSSVWLESACGIYGGAVRRALWVGGTEGT